MVNVIYRRLLPASLMSILLLSLSACAWFGKKGAASEPEPTLADLQPARLPDRSVTLPQVDLDTLTRSYRDVMELTQDAEVKVQVMQRLAGLEMERGETRLVEAQTQQDVLGVAIQAYRDLLEQYPNRDDNDRLLYQLSKAYDLNGQPELSLQVLGRVVKDYPHSDHRIESQFRLAENYFSLADYRRAAQAYAEVVKGGDETGFYRNALYMLGWSQFKRDRYQMALQSFSSTLELLIPSDNSIASLPNAQRALANDTLRVMSVALSYLDGPATLMEMFNQPSVEPHYLPLLFERLGDLYLSQERYRDSAEVYRAYVQLNPTSKRAPAYYGKLISAFEAGNFTEQVREEKRNYVDRYGITSDYWSDGDEMVRGLIRPYLKQYLDELARHHHALAQTLITPGKKPGKRSNKKETARLKQQAKSHFMRAGDYYQAYVDTFPEDKNTPEMVFLLAESRFDAGDYPAAIPAFEAVAYRYSHNSFSEDRHSGDRRAADAGYSAILAYQHYIETLEGQDGSEQSRTVEWLRNKIGSALRFAHRFKQDSRAPTVLAQSAEELLALKAYEQAVLVAEKLTTWKPEVSPELLRTGWLVVGHSQFELKNFPAAEIAYENTLALPGDKAARQPLVERLAASIYKQGEQMVATGDQLAAADQFLRIAKVAPQSAIVVNAQYDAASNLLAAAEWTRAIEILEDFRRRYPRHELTRGVPAQLVVAYQEAGQWQLAAEELSAIYQVETDPDAKRQALYLSAELFEKAGNKETAILRFRSYAHTYEQPFAQCMEARYRLSELYRETSQGWKRRFWLKKIIAADQHLKDQRSDRTHYLAAFASNVLADDAFSAFQQIKIAPPLKKSMKKKKSALTKALGAYQKTVDYGIEEFATQGTYRIGDIYASLSRDLMASKPPKNLDDLALEQYQLLLEEQAYPFEEKAIEIHEANAQRSWQGVYDRWVKQSFAALGDLLPVRYRKEEQRLEVSYEIY